MFRVILRGWAAVSDETDRPITSPSVLRELSGLSYDDEFFTDYLGGPELENALATALERSGNLKFDYVEAAELLRVTTEFRATRKLSQDELQCLVEYTLGQWSDGIGENFTCESASRCGYTVMCLDAHAFPGAVYPEVEILEE